MTFASTVIPSSQAVPAGRPAQYPKLIGRRKPVLDAEPACRLVLMHRHADDASRELLTS